MRKLPSSRRLVVGEHDSPSRKIITAESELLQKLKSAEETVLPGDALEASAHVSGI